MKQRTTKGDINTLAAVSQIRCGDHLPALMDHELMVASTPNTAHRKASNGKITRAIKDKLTSKQMRRNQPPQ